MNILIFCGHLCTNTQRGCNSTRTFSKLSKLSKFPPSKIWSWTSTSKHACAVATSPGFGTQMATENKHRSAQVAVPKVQVSSYLDGFCVSLFSRTRYAPGSTAAVSQTSVSGVTVWVPKPQKGFKMFRGISYYLKRGSAFPNLCLKC